jgi:hypothetical protein
MPLTIPWQFASATTNTPTIRLDQNYDSIKNWINSRNPTVGLLSARPAAGNAGAIYMTSDEANTLYLDNGTAWAAAAGGGTSSAVTNLLLNGGIVGTSGVGVIAMGPSTAPTSSPVDTVQLYARDFEAAAGSMGLYMRDERGGQYGLGSYSANKSYLRIFSPNGVVKADMMVDDAVNSLTIGTVAGHQVNFVIGYANRIILRTDGLVEVNTAVGMRSIGVGGPDSAGAGYRYLRVTN